MADEVVSLARRFIEQKRALGRKYHSEERELRLLVRFAEVNGIRDLSQFTAASLEEFLASRPRRRPRSFNHFLGVAGGFLDWTVTQQLLAVSPLHTRPRRATSGRVPFIFDVADARRLLAAAAALPDNSRAQQRGPTYRAIFALCYGLGLRAGEACGLTWGDIGAGRSLLTVHGGKFGKTRLVPHGPRIAGLVGEQAARRARAGAADVQAPLFTFDGQRPVHPGTASQTFHRLVTGLGLTAPAGISPPTLHSLRHSFAIGCLLRWYQQNLNPSARLHHLSTFMGHVDPDSQRST